VGLIITLKEDEKIYIDCSCGKHLEVKFFARNGYNYPHNSVKGEFTGDMKVVRQRPDIVKNIGELFNIVKENK